MSLGEDVQRAAKRSAELAEMSDAKRIDRLRAELAEAKARIAALEAQCLHWMKVCTREGEKHFLKRMWQLEREKTALIARAELAEAKARIAELEEALHVTLDEREEEMARAERAEAARENYRRLHSYVDGIPSDEE